MSSSIAPSDEKPVPSGRPRKPGVRGDGVEIEGGAPPENRFTIVPRRLFCPFLAGQKGTSAPPVKTPEFRAGLGPPALDNRVPLP